MPLTKTEFNFHGKGQVLSLVIELALAMVLTVRCFLGTCSKSGLGLRGLALLIAIIFASAKVQAGLPRALPNDVSVNANTIIQFLQDVTQMSEVELHHLIIVKDGYVITEVHADPYRANDPHNLFSASKMFTALAVGLAVDDGSLSLDDKVVDFFPDKCPDSIMPEMADITVRHLLTMTSGKQVKAQIRDNSDDWVASWLALPGTAPGETFAYDTMTPFILSAIVQRATGCTILDLLQSRILQPMGITDVEWELSPDGINTGGWGVRCSAETMAMLGQLLLQQGCWDDHQLISREWAVQMTIDQLSTMGIQPSHAGEYQCGYGYLMWRCSWETGYRAEGNYGQYVIIDPSLNLVIVTCGTIPSQSRLLAPVKSFVQRLSQNQSDLGSSDQQALDDLCQNIQMDKANGRLWNSIYPCAHLILSENLMNIKELYIQHHYGDGQLVIVDDTGCRDTLSLGYNEWLYTPMHGKPYYNIAAKNRFSGMDRGFTAAGNFAWPSTEEIEIRIHHVDWYSAMILVINFNQNQLSFTYNQWPTWHEMVDFTMVPLSSVNGDVTGDGTVDISDVNSVINIMLGKKKSVTHQ